MRTSASFNAALAAVFSALTTGAGVLAGATSPHQTEAVKAGSPSSFEVGTLGSNAERLALATASGRNVPDLIWLITSSGLIGMNVRRSPIRSVMAGAPPLYGTCSTSMPADSLSISPARWPELPLPAEPKLSLPGSALAWAISPFIDVMLDLAGTTTTSDASPIRATGAKSVAGLKLSLLNSAAFVARLFDAIMIV